MVPPPSRPPEVPPFETAARLWFKIGCLSFGGPAGQIALLHRMVVDERRWVSDRRFLQGLNFCTLLPGPEAQQLATYLGWLMHGAAGGLTAGLLFIVPGAMVMLALSALYATLGTVPLVAALFLGLKSAVLALVVEALLRIGRRALKGRWASAMAAGTFLALFVFAIPFPLVMLGAGLVGALAPAHFIEAPRNAAQDGDLALIDALIEADPAFIDRRRRGAQRAGIICAAVWLLPLFVLCGGVFADMARFFATMAVVTFGGAYAILAYAAQQAVGTFHWLSAPEMLSGLGLAETTPGPLILVLQFIGFLAGFRAPGAVTGLWGGVLASALTLWMTFAPCFALVFLGAPLIESLQRNRRLSGALAAMTAGIVGVIANLALWFALRSLFHETMRLGVAGATIEFPVPSSIDVSAVLLAALAALALFRYKLGLPSVLAISAAAGVLLHVAASLV